MYEDNPEKQKFVKEWIKSRGWKQDGRICHDVWLYAGMEYDKKQDKKRIAELEEALSDLADHMYPHVSKEFYDGILALLNKGE